MPFLTPCQFCGALFEATRTDAAYCSDSHRAQAARIASRARRRREGEALLASYARTLAQLHVAARHESEPVALLDSKLAEIERRLGELISR